MRRLFLLIMIGVFIPAFIYAQRSVKTVTVIHAKPVQGLFMSYTLQPPKHSLNLDIITQPGNRLIAILSGESIIKLPRSAFISAELAYSDLVENTITKFNENLINSCDEQIPELFKDAPSLFKIKCVLSLRLKPIFQ